MTIRSMAVLVLGLWIAAPVHAAPPAVEIVVSGAEYISTLAYPITEEESRTLDRTSRRIEELATRAKSDFAESLGYTRKRFGEQNWKVIGDLRVSTITLKTDHRTVALRSEEMPAGSHDDTPDDDAPAEPLAPQEAPAEPADGGDAGESGE